MLDQLPEAPEATDATQPPASPDGRGGDAFLTAVFDDAQTMWRQEFEDAGSDYTPAKLTINSVNGATLLLNSWTVPSGT